MKSFRIFLLATVVVAMLVSFCPAPAGAADYWNGYWGWYDGTYVPAYQRYYSTPSYYGPSYSYYGPPSYSYYGAPAYSTYGYGYAAPYGGTYYGVPGAGVGVYPGGTAVRVGPLGIGWR
jgi:hypothetical protein